MNCKQAQEWISREMDGELHTVDQIVLEKHLMQCPACKKVKEHWMSASQLLKQTADVKIPDATDVWAEIRSQIEKEKLTSRNTLFPFPALLKWTSAAAAIIAVTLGIRFMTPEPAEIFAFQNEVEFVETDLSDSSPVVYIDEESGWAIVWILQSLDEGTT